MHLYEGSTAAFIGDAAQNRLATNLADRFFAEFRYRPGPAEVMSWRNSLAAMASVLQLADLTDQGILVELKLPLSSQRLDVLITGSNSTTKADSAVIVELKQWTDVERSNITDCVAVSFGGGYLKDHLHPSRQVAQYQRYLQDTHPAFTNGDIALDACAYVHFATYDPKSPLFGLEFKNLLATNPSFTGDKVNDLADYLTTRVEGPDEGDNLLRVAASAFKPHKRLLDHVAGVIRREPVFTLVDEQLVAYNAILDSVGPAGANQQSVAIIVSGGPGTGKSVIAINLVAELSARGIRTLHLTGSNAFTENLRKIVGPRASAVFKYFRDTAKATEPIDVAVLDEAHRIRTVSTDRFTPAISRSGKAQIDDILDASRVSVFFIDDLQVVRPGEVGSTELIRESAAKRGLEVREFELQAQFRSNGSDSFIKWIDNTLELDRTPQILWPADDDFDFQIVGSVGQLESMIRARAEEGAAARLVAGFCWPWSDPDDFGQLVPDVKVGDWAMPWNAKPDGKRIGPGIPKSDFWASDSRGIDQVGCVYTAQGFEFDYVGVIFGPDLVYRPMQGWIGQPEESRDSVVRRTRSVTDFTAFVKSTYRVLLTRGLRGCYAHFMDARTRDFFASRVERPVGAVARVAELPLSYGDNLG
jgi:hypothetical protein